MRVCSDASLTLFILAKLKLAELGLGSGLASSLLLTATKVSSFVCSDRFFFFFSLGLRHCLSLVNTPPQYPDALSRRITPKVPTGPPKKADGNDNGDINGSNTNTNINDSEGRSSQAHQEVHPSGGRSRREDNKPGGVAANTENGAAQNAGDIGEATGSSLARGGVEAESGPGSGASGGGGGGGGVAAAPGTVLLDGSYDKELSSIRGQV